MFRLRIRVAWTSWFPASEKPIRNRAIPNEIGSTKLLSKLLLLSLKSLEFTCMVVVQAMVLDVLHGRSPLYRIEQFIEQQHRELLLGQEIDPHLFNDTTIARSLDALFAAGPSKIITQLGIRAVQVFELDMHALSYDTTSTSVWGEYRGSEEKSSPGPAITFGHSKDQRPDLKQIMTELLCVDRGVPIAGSSLDGNSSDKKSNNAMLTRIMRNHIVGWLSTQILMTNDN